MAIAVSHRPPPAGKPLDASLRGYLAANADIVTRVRKPVHMADIGALSAQSEQPILFENIVEKPGFRLCDILVKNRRSQARALGTTPENYLRTLAYRLRQPPRGLKTVKTGPVKEVVKLHNEADWTELPIPFHKDKDAAPYVTAMNIIRDPETGFYFDDTRRYIEANAQLGPAEKKKVYEGNARRVYPRLDRALKAKGK